MTNKNIEDVDALVEALADAISYVTASCGVSSNKLNAAIQRSYHELKDDDTLQGEKGPVRPSHRQIGKIVSFWRASSVYTDELGEPSPIPMNGPPPSLHHLFNEAKAQFNESAQTITFADAIDILMKNGAIQETDEGTFVLVASIKGAALNVHPVGGVAPLPLLSYIVEFAQTIAHNIRCRTKYRENPPTQFQMVASTEKFPQSMLPRVEAMLDSEGMQLLRRVDQFIETAAINAPEDEKRVFVGVGLYLLRSDGDRFAKPSLNEVNE
ncbi:MAG: hypothetical protein WBN07_16610 [Woeseiaceae bacterium]